MSDSYYKKEEGKKGKKEGVKSMAYTNSYIYIYTYMHTVHGGDGQVNSRKAAVSVAIWLKVRKSL